MKIVDRFMARVEMVPEAGCWLWTGKLSGAGYGELRLGGRGSEKILAHRLSYELFVGPLSGLQALHRCDVPCCVNPAHLFAGTHQDNMQDMVAKGRQPSIDSFIGVPYRKLSPEDHLAIARSPATSKELAQQYGVHYTHINWIRRKAREI